MGELWRQALIWPIQIVIEGDDELTINYDINENGALDYDGESARAEREAIRDGIINHLPNVNAREECDAIWVVYVDKISSIDNTFYGGFYHFADRIAFVRSSPSDSFLKHATAHEWGHAVMMANWLDDNHVQMDETVMNDVDYTSGWLIPIDNWEDVIRTEVTE